MILCGPSFCRHWVVCYCSCSGCAICCLSERWLTQCVIIIEYSHIIVIIYRSVAVSWTCIFIWQTCLIWHQNKYMFRTNHVFLDNIFGSIRKYLSHMDEFVVYNIYIYNIFFIVHFILFLFFTSFFSYLYLCIFSCVCIPYNRTVHGADLTYISLLVIFCIIVWRIKILNFEMTNTGTGEHNCDFRRAKRINISNIVT